MAEAYPTEAVTERADGSLEVVLAVSEPAWLERLLLRLGPGGPGRRAEPRSATLGRRGRSANSAAATATMHVQGRAQTADLTPERTDAHERMTR